MKRIFLLIPFVFLFQHAFSKQQYDSLLVKLNIGLDEKKQFDAEKLKRIESLKQQLISSKNPVYKQAALQVRANKTADPRLFVNALQPWVDSLRFDGVNYAPAAKPNFYAGNTGVYGWGVKKYAPITYNENVGLNNNGVADAWNYYLLRMADVYLLYAEASINSGDNPTGLEYINKVKRRAYGYPINVVSAVDYQSLSDNTVAAGDPVLGTKPLYYERWAELFNEGHWWFDVCRWRIGPSEAAYYKTAINVNGPLTFNESKSYSWPIPISELNTNSKIKQNPGY